MSRRPGWLYAESRRARERAAHLPNWARPVVTVPHRGEMHEDVKPLLDWLQAHGYPVDAMQRCVITLEVREPVRVSFDACRVHDDVGYCGCCGEQVERLDAPWCDPCAGHVLPTGQWWDRTYAAQHGRPCPFQVGGTS
jgi:hypothetical protein